MHVHVRRIALALLVLAMPACAANGTSAPGSPRRASSADDEDRTTVRVENQGWAEATIYVLRLSQRIRLGEVPSQGTRVFTIPDDVVGAVNSLRFEADPVGSSRTARSFDVTVVRGRQLSLTIPPNAF
jgi:hypothetical protein